MCIQSGKQIRSGDCGRRWLAKSCESENFAFSKQTPLLAKLRSSQQYQPAAAAVRCPLGCTEWCISTWSRVPSLLCLIVSGLCNFPRMRRPSCRIRNQTVQSFPMNFIRFRSVAVCVMLTAIWHDPFNMLCGYSSAESETGDNFFDLLTFMFY